MLSVVAWAAAGAGGDQTASSMLSSSSAAAPRQAMTWPRALRSINALAAHCFLLCFSCLLVAKLSRHIHLSWWWVFMPLWMFHAIVSRGRFSLPAPLSPHGRNWAPCHTVVAVPLLVAFELLLCTYLDGVQVYGEAAVSLKLVFLPLLTFEATILIDNFRMCRALMPSDEESMTNEAIWETLPHFWVAVSMVFFMAATMFTLLKLSGDVGALGWWDLFINFGIAEFFTFLVGTKWSNPSIHRTYHQPQTSEHSPLSRPLQRMESACNTTFGTERDDIGGICGREEFGGHIIKFLVLLFQVLLCMRLEGTPAKARHIPLVLIFGPLLLIQGVAIFFALLRVLEKVCLLMHIRDEPERPSVFISRAHDCFSFLHHGSRFLGWWSIDEKSREEQVCLLVDDSSGYSTFTGPPPEVIRKMAKKDLTEEVWRLQAALGEQTEIARDQQQKFVRLQNVMFLI
ncbi:hypothetical protein O6H91_03G028700 [Diphasiastrum complanatum]|uniref:Uncharacterized protein n=1 Tax=Diphasiastrum complanatum TaxID=34168 RepID=A0ACC2E4J5_DIPCM|nr:hypothetical protein O6H91_03G028700 [Diphasiastrum complanatum]